MGLATRKTGEPRNGVTVVHSRDGPSLYANGEGLVKRLGTRKNLPAVRGRHTIGDVTRSGSFRQALGLLGLPLEQLTRVAAVDAILGREKVDPCAGAIFGDQRKPLLL